MAAFAALCLLPFLLVIIASLSSEKSITLNGYTYFPSEWSLEAYKVMTAPSSSLPRSYLITIAVTGIGTFCAALITYCAGYALANRLCKYRNALALYFFATMVFSAGLVPWYMIAKMLGCYNNIFALIVPSLMFSPFNMFLVRNFIAGIPDSLNESARIDGAGELHIAFRIYFPLCTPVLATVTLFYAIGYWNNYFNAVMLLDSQKLYPLQMLLFKIQSEITMMSRVLQGVNLNPPKESFKMAAAVVVMGPIILLYPLLQRYFIKGMIVGAIKG
ncbi:MAG: carbohydrate ABC transporter permease [Clostridiales bacterium]|nr:carbohydrate ABC transporter permease [Clostridiales bacterium]